MPGSDFPCLNLGIDQLLTTEEDHFAIWILQAPYPGGYVHHDCLWPSKLQTTWRAWQSMFTLGEQGNDLGLAPEAGASHSGRLMQDLGVELWQWVFHGPIQTSFSHSQGIAMGQNKPLRLRLDVRTPNLITLPWEIMQPQPGKQAISLSQQVLFSRTTSDVDPLPDLEPEQGLRFLLVLGHDNGHSPLALEQEAASLVRVLKDAQTIDQGSDDYPLAPVPCQVDTLLEPTATQLIASLESGAYNIFFYAGHGLTGPDGGILFIAPHQTMNGTELAQVLTRCRVSLAVFNSCWGAYPDRNSLGLTHRSSLAEVLLHHGVPAVLAMRDPIADQEATTFIQALTRGLSRRLPIDQAVAVARQTLITLYKFNQPAWTLPVLYMHPQFNGELIQSTDEGMTELPDRTVLTASYQHFQAFVRLLVSPSRSWLVRDGLMRIGRREGNDLVIPEQWVSQRHAEIFCRDTILVETNRPAFFLRDFSRYGTLVSTETQDWDRVHHREVLITSGTKLKFGSSRGQTLEFVVQSSPLPPAE